MEAKVFLIKCLFNQ